jgi:uncharacterized protein YjbJ (UPF0337 family)
VTSATQVLAARNELLGQRFISQSQSSLAKEFQMGSTADRISGKANELAGKARQGVGEATDDREMQAKGMAQAAKGDAQQAKGGAKEAVKKVVDKA